MGELRMLGKERIPLETLARVDRGELTVVAAVEIMGLSEHQARRVWKRYREMGDSGLIHRLRSRVSNRRLEADMRAPDARTPNSCRDGLCVLFLWPVSQLLQQLLKVSAIDPAADADPPQGNAMSGDLPNDF